RPVFPGVVPRPLRAKPTRWHTAPPTQVPARAGTYRLKPPWRAIRDLASKLLLARQGPHLRQALALDRFKEVHHVRQALAALPPAGYPDQSGRQLAYHPRPDFLEPGECLPRRDPRTTCVRILDHGRGHGSRF